MTCRLALLR